MANLNEELVASYEVTIGGIDRARDEMKRVDQEVQLLRKTVYSENAGVSQLSAGDPDVLVTRVNALEGRVQSATQKAMASSMALGRRTQIAALNAAETPTGRNRPGGSAGRNKTGAMIRAVSTNVETRKMGKFSQITGWHGWRKDGRAGYFDFQERGTKGRGGDDQANAGLRRNKNKPVKRAAGQKRSKGAGVPAANSLGLSIITVREFLKKELKGLR